MATRTHTEFFYEKLAAIKEGARVVVVGLGVSGLSAALFCRQQGADVTVSEMRSVAQLDVAFLEVLRDKGIEIEAGGHTPDLFLSADLLLVSPGVPLDSPILRRARQKGVVVAGEMSLAGPYLKTPLVAVTGTNGKTTVTTLLGDIFRAAGRRVFVGGNIGTPLTEYLAGPQEADVVILEVSSFQLDSAVGFRPDVAVLLNISADHLDRYDSFTDYALSKLSIFQNQQGSDVSIINGDDSVIEHFLENATSLRHGWAVRSSFFFSKKIGERNGAVVEGQKVKMVANGRQGDAETYDLENTELSTLPNLENSMAAILAAQSMGCDAKSIAKGLDGFRNLSHRLSFVAEIDGVRYLDDSKATNVGAVDAALDSLAVPVVLIAGGRDKGGDYAPLRANMQKKVKGLLLIGEAQETMAAMFRKDTVVENLDSLEQAVIRARELATCGDVVLLSPACSSFDMFRSYKERGDVFCRSVKKLK